MPNAPHKHPQFPLRVPEDTLDKMKFIAAYQGRSTNMEIGQAMLSHICRFEKKHGEIELTDDDYEFIRKHSQWRKGN